MKVLEKEFGQNCISRIAAAKDPLKMSMLSNWEGTVLRRICLMLYCNWCSVFDNCCRFLLHVGWMFCWTDLIRF